MEDREGRGKKERDALVDQRRGQIHRRGRQLIPCSVSCHQNAGKGACVQHKRENNCNSLLLPQNATALRSIKHLTLYEGG